MDTSYLTSQIATIIAQLHTLFDDIGVPSHERNSRESELFTALSETLHNHLRQVAAEKNELTEEGHRIIQAIKQMEASLEDGNTLNERAGSSDLQITFPLAQCLQTLKQKHTALSKLHRERFEQVKKLVQALESYSSHLEPSFVQVALPPTSDDAVCPPTFDLSPKYVAALDNEFTRVFAEYSRRIAAVREMSEEIVRLWAELGTPQAQTDSSIVKYHKDAPEQLGLHESDLQRLSSLKQGLSKQRSDREQRLKELKNAVEALWDRLGMEQADRKRFLNANRGCSLRVMNDFEDELARLNELKRQNLHLFVEDARCKLQDLWDALYFSEDEMLEFTPAFSDVYSDALLSSHEAEVARLEALKEQRAPILQMIEKHKSLVKDRDELATSSQDASRLMARGQKGERRDPTRLLREEKMRKRIAKELPKVEAELRKLLDDWEDEYGRPFCVRGERYLDELGAAAAAATTTAAANATATSSGGATAAHAAGRAGAQPPRSKTPSNRSARPNSASQPRPASSAHGPAPTGRAGAKTPTGSLRRNPLATSTSAATLGRLSPSKIPARVPLSNMPYGSNSPERGGAASAAAAANAKDRAYHSQQPATAMKITAASATAAAPGMAPPPKMRSLVNLQQQQQHHHPLSASGPPGGAIAAHQFPLPNNDARMTMSDALITRSASAGSSSQGSVRNVPPEDVYLDQPLYHHPHHNNQHHTQHHSQAPFASHVQPSMSRSQQNLLGSSSHHAIFSSAMSSSLSAANAAAAARVAAMGVNSLGSSMAGLAISSSGSSGNSNNHHHQHNIENQRPPSQQSYARLPLEQEQQQQQQQPHHQQSSYRPAMGSRQISAASTATNTLSGSENWETYDDDTSEAEPEPDASEAYYAKLRAARVQQQRFAASDAGYPVTSTSTASSLSSFSSSSAAAAGGRGATSGNGSSAGVGVGTGNGSVKIKGIRGPPGMAPGPAMVETSSGRMICVSGSDAGWTDEDGAY